MKFHYPGCDSVKQMGVFNQVAGVLLGTFTYYERTNPGLSVFDLLKMHINDNLPVAYTTGIGQFNYRLLSMCYNIFSASLNHIWKKKVRFTCRSGNSWRNHSDDRL